MKKKATKTKSESSKNVVDYKLKTYADALAMNEGNGMTRIYYAFRTAAGNNSVR